MILSDIRAMPKFMTFGPDSKRIHESCFRSYHIVQKVRYLLSIGTPHEVIMEIIEDLETAKEESKT